MCVCVCVCVCVYVCVLCIPHFTKRGAKHIGSILLDFGSPATAAILQWYTQREFVIKDKRIPGNST